MPTQTYPQPQAPFRLNPQLTAVVNMTVNVNLIANRALPVIPVNQETVKYLVIPDGPGFTIPETLVGARGEANEIHTYATEDTTSVDTHALMDAIPRQIQEQANERYNPAGAAAETTRDLILLQKEVSMANTLFNPNNFPVGRKKTLAGASQWSDPNSDPIGEILRTKDKMVMRPNIFVIGRKVATNLILHPQIIKAFHRNEGDSGVVSLEFLANLLGFEEVLVGDAWVNEQQLLDPSLTRVWGNRAVMLHRSSQSRQTVRGISTLSWGVTFVWRVQGQDLGVFRWFDPKPGGTGVDWVKVTHRYKHVVIASQHGYIWVDAVEE